MWTYNYSDELYHYGIKGMKWGVRRFQDKNGRLTNAGKKRYSEDESKKESEEEQNQETTKPKTKRKLTKKQKILLAGAAVVTAYASYKIVGKLINEGSANRLVLKGKHALGVGESDFFKKNQALSNKNLNPDELMSKVVSRINPKYGKIGTKNNCRRCTFAYEMSRRGYDVKATKTVFSRFGFSSGQNVISLHNATNAKNEIKGSTTKLSNLIKFSIKDEQDPSFTKLHRDKSESGNNLLSNYFSKVQKGSFGYSTSIFDTLSNFPDRSRGELTLSWSSGGAHSMAWEIVNNKPVIFDCQTGTKYDSVKTFKSLEKHISDAGVSRLDNIELNKDFLLRWLTNA